MLNSPHLSRRFASYGVRATRHALVLLLFIVCVGLPVPSAASPGSSRATWGLIKGRVSVAPVPGSPGWFRVESRGRGWMTGVGRIEVVWVVPEVRLDLVNRTLTVADLEWSGTITAANGDELYGRYSFQNDTIPFTRFGTVRFGAVLNVTGGTGRFENATGQARSVGIANICTRRFRIGLGGTLFSSE